MATKRALPDVQNAPSLRLESGGRCLVACSIAADFLLPEGAPVLWPAKQLAIVTVPKATVNEDRSSMTPEDEIGPTRKPPIMKSESESHRMETTSDDHFRLGVASPDTGHHSAARGGVYYVMRQARNPVPAQRVLRHRQ